MIRAVFKTSTFCSLSLADIPWGGKHFPRSLLNEQYLSTHHHTLENHTESCWFGEFGSFWWQQRLVWFPSWMPPLPAIILLSPHKKWITSCDKKESSSFLLHVILRKSENFNSQSVGFSQPCAFMTFYLQNPLSQQERVSTNTDSHLYLKREWSEIFEARHTVHRQILAFSVLVVLKIDQMRLGFCYF